jgi:biopolymer transport protein TolQ
MDNIGILALIGQIAAPIAGPITEATVTSPTDMSVLKLVRDAGPVVKAVLLMLTVFSVVSWAIIITKLIQLRKVARESAGFLKVFWEARDLDEIQTSARAMKSSPTGEIFLAGYRELNRVRKARTGNTAEGGPGLVAGIDNVQRALNHAASTEIAKLERAVPFLATAGNASPFIGLFGTVWGIMSSFQSIGVLESASLVVVAPGISEALVATAVGLFAAIPAVIFYNHFSTKIHAIEVELQNFAGEFLNILERHLNRIP